MLPELMKLCVMIGFRYAFICNRNGLPVYKVLDQTSAEEAFHRFQKDIGAPGCSTVWIHIISFPFIHRWNIGADCRMGRPHFGYHHPSGDTVRDVPVYCTQAIERQAIAARASPMHDATPYSHVRIRDPNFDTDERMCAARMMTPAYAGLLEAIKDGRDIDTEVAALLDLQVDHQRKPVDVLCAADMRSVLHVCGHPTLTDAQTQATSEVDYAALPRDVAVATLAKVAVTCMCLKPGEQHGNRVAAVKACEDALANIVFGRNHKTGDKMSPAGMDSVHGAHYKAIAGQGHLSFNYKAGQTDHYQLQRLQGMKPEVAQHVQPCIGTREGYMLYSTIIADLKSASKSGTKKLTNQAVSFEWNKRVLAKLEAAKTQQEKDFIGQSLGFQLDRAVERLANKVSKRVVSIQVHAGIATALHDLAKRNLSLRKPVKLDQAPPPRKVNVPPPSKALAPSAPGVPAVRQPTDALKVLSLSWCDRASFCVKCYMAGENLNKCRQWVPKNCASDKDEKATVARALDALKTGGPGTANHVMFRNGHTRKAGNGASILCSKHPEAPAESSATGKAMKNLKRRVLRYVNKET